jgi:hypothetical protein
VRALPGGPSSTPRSPDWRPCAFDRPSGGSPIER